MPVSRRTPAQLVENTPMEGLAARAERGALGYDLGMTRLPGWVVDDATSVRREVAEWRGLSHAQLWELARRCSRDAMWAIRASGRAEQILAHEDPLPDTTVRALERLRHEAGWPRAH